jgi:hypothetical protein
MEFNISDIFQEVFGVRVTKGYIPPPIDNKPKGINDGSNVIVRDEAANMPQLSYSGIEIIEDVEEAKQMSALGTPILFPITLKGSKYMQYNLKGEVELKQMGDYRLPITAIADFRRSKIIGKTRAVAGDATVKETYGFDDWKITIRGFFLKEENQPQGKITAYEQEAELLQWENLVDAIKVEGFFFQMRNIHNIVIKEVPVQMIRGNPKLKPFVIKAESDKPFELIL